ncbi:GlmL-related ornithine degradation protein [Bacillus tuaregi]|uniref:GlmL-related ornithine degradation protein n=1 Tax=Bacillus tuaregi TaxID=1816695 RepID=UPI0008F8FDFC|nr:GlmL-related ornithine degradation protein [Bacillus tuaregi]
MKVDVLVAEIGSTTTVVNAFNHIHTENPVFVGQGQAPTSVMEGDVTIGLNASIADLQRSLNTDSLEYDEMFATSSAAGGLKMTVHGLVFDMTARAAKEAALGAGAIIHLVTAGKLRRGDLKKIQDLNPNIILIAGGVDYGERDTALNNAEAIRGLNLNIPIIYAGNIENQEEIKLIFEDTKQRVYIVENVFPRIDELNVEPTRKVIQEAFEEHIIHAPGMETIRNVVNEAITPTPGAVMQASKLLGKYLKDIIVIDVGGATTDIHSVTVGSDAIARIQVAPEPTAKRTVEGDLGVYVNRENIIDLITREKLEEEGFNVDKILEEYHSIPKNDEEFRFVERLTEVATLMAVERHAGRIRYVYGPEGRATLAQGKDLTEIKYIIGTGGALTRLPAGKEIMMKIMEQDNPEHLLLPNKGAEVLIDHDYIMASLGVLSMKYEDAAAKLLGKSLGIDLMAIQNEESDWSS